MKLELNGKPRVLVAGDLMVDHYLWGYCDRISPEAPVQVVDVFSETLSLGGAGNVVANLKALGAHVGVMGVVGDCIASKEIVTLLEDMEITDTHLIVDPGRRLSKKSRIIAGKQQVVRFDRETKDDVSDETSAKLIWCYEDILSDYDCVILSDYGKGMLSDRVVSRFIKYGNRLEKLVLVDPKGSDYTKYCGATLITPNKKEAVQFLGEPINNMRDLKRALAKLKEACCLDFALITLSEDGIAILDDDVRVYPTVARQVSDVTGAGDTVIAALGFSLSMGQTIDDAVIFANRAAGVVVGKLGSATASIEEIENYPLTTEKTSSHSSVTQNSELSEICSNLRSAGKKIVFTNGCFDIVHSGHIEILENAKEQGDILVVGLNSDRSVRELKGADRPINSELDRARVLLALKSVDYVVIFDEATPETLAEIIQPHTLVKGADYVNDSVAGASYAQKIHFVPLVDGRSTTEIIERIRRGNV